MSEAKRFRKKPVVIEAVQFTEDMVKAHLFDKEPLPEGVRLSSSSYHPERRCLYSWTAKIDTLEGPMTVSPGDWIIRGVKGEFYPCRADIFAETYEEVGDAAR